MARLQHFLIILLLLVFGCKSTRQAKSEMFPIISMERTSCLGTCPAYLFRAFPDGSVTYTGEVYVDLVGKFEGCITKEELTNLKNLFDEADYFGFANVYSANITDLPTTYLYYDNGAQNSKVTNYYRAPESLKKLENDVESFINAIDWQKIK